MTVEEGILLFGMISALSAIILRRFFQDALAGALLRLSSQIRCGAGVEFAGVAGWVERIGVFATYFRAESGELLVLPNTLVLRMPTSLCPDMSRRRTWIKVRVEDHGDWDRTISALQSGVETIEPGIAGEVEVLMHGLERTSAVLHIQWWCGSRPVDEVRSRDAVLRCLIIALYDLGGEVPGYGRCEAPSRGTRKRRLH